MVRIKADTKALSRFFRTFGQKTGPLLREALEVPAIQTWADLIEATNTNLQARSGALQKGWTKPEFVGNGWRSLRISFINEVKYASIHEFGGTITAKGKALAIPLDGAKTGAGVPRFASPRDIVPEKGGYTFVTKGGVLLWSGGKESGRGGTKLIPMYVFKKSVEIPPRLGAREVMEKNVPEFERAIIDLMREMWGG